MAHVFKYIFPSNKVVQAKFENCKHDLFMDTLFYDAYERSPSYRLGPNKKYDNNSSYEQAVGH